MDLKCVRNCTIPGRGLVEKGEVLPFDGKYNPKQKGQEWHNHFEPVKLSGAQAKAARAKAKAEKEKAEAEAAEKAAKAAAKKAEKERAEAKAAEAAAAKAANEAEQSAD